MYHQLMDQPLPSTATNTQYYSMKVMTTPHVHDTTHTHTHRRARTHGESWHLEADFIMLQLYSTQVISSQNAAGPQSHRNVVSVIQCI